MSKIRQRRSGGGEPVVRTLGSRYPDGFVLDAHAHDWSQLLYASSGVMLVETDAGSWIVPPHRAVWLPASASHRITMRGEVAMRTAYFANTRVGPKRTCVVEVSPLLRELLVYVSKLGKLDTSRAHEARLAGLLVDLLAAVETIPLALPMPTEARALRVANAIRADPARELDAKTIGRLGGGSLRTIERFFLRDTGMTFGKWRQQARLLAALTMLADDVPVTTVALDVGYASPSAFIAMFKNALGTTPSRFFS